MFHSVLHGGGALFRHAASGPTALLLLTGLLLAARPPDPPALVVQFDETTVHQPVMAVLAMPGDTARLSIASPSPGASPYRVEAGHHTVQARSAGTWAVRVPHRPGLYPLTVTDASGNRATQLQVFVLRPWDHEGRVLNGYRLGNYEDTPLEGRERYTPPTGFIEVTDANRRVRVSPHFRLEQFLCKQTDATPQYALVQPRLLRVLEDVLTTLNERGHALETLHVMSGYRTPHYNRAIGNDTEYSRHLYGDAADIFVDADRDGWMDDLTGDGRVTTADAEHLADVVRSIPTAGADSFVGGLGVYGPAPHRGPFVHLDLRGEQARW